VDGQIEEHRMDMNFGISEGRTIFELILEKYDAIICLWIGLYYGILCFGFGKSHVIFLPNE
jgi:hypothetical protein